MGANIKKRSLNWAALKVGAIVRLYYRDAAFGFVELNDAILKGKDGPITADANIETRVDLSAALTDDDIAGNHCFAAKTLDPKSLGMAVSAVA